MSAPSLRDWILRSIDRPQTPRLRISQAGRACEREVYYSATGAEAEPDKPESRVKMAIGSAFDAYALANPNCQWNFQVPVTVALGATTISGTADAVFYGNREPLHVADLKTVGNKTWAKVQKAPKQEHRAQVQLYAYGLGAPTFSVCYVNADTGEIIEHYGTVDEYEARKDFGMFEEVSYWLSKGEPPPRPYADFENEDGTEKIAKDSFPCAWCKFRTTCWQSEEEAINVAIQRT